MPTNTNESEAHSFQTMKEETRHKLTEGWLRIFLGSLQIILAGAAALLWASGANERIVWILAGATLIVVIISRALYRSH